MDVLIGHILDARTNWSRNDERTVAEALQQIGDPRAVERLIAALADSDADVRRCAGSLDCSATQGRRSDRVYCTWQRPEGVWQLVFHEKTLAEIHARP